MRPVYIARVRLVWFQLRLREGIREFTVIEMYLPNCMQLKRLEQHDEDLLQVELPEK